MRLVNTRPELIVAESMIPAAASVVDIFRALTLKLSTRIAPANDR